MNTSKCNVALHFNSNMVFLRVKMLRSQLCCRWRSSLVGRDIVNLRDLEQQDIKSLIWTALDLKHNRKVQKQNHILQGRHVTFLVTHPDPNPFNQAAAGRALASIGGNVSTIVNNSLETQDRRHIEDLGRALSTTSDIILADSHDDSFISKLADGANIPTVAWRSEKFAILHALADAMTVYEHFNILSPLTLSWVGPPTALFNSYLYIMPRMKINLRFCCNDSDSSCQTSPAMMNVGVKNSIINKTEFHECSSPADAVDRTDIIVTTGHNIPSLTLIKKHVDEASLEYIFLHDLPRGKCEVADDIFHSKHSVTWKSRENVSWMSMAVMVNLTQDYRPSFPQPRWEIE